MNKFDSSNYKTTQTIDKVNVREHLNTTVKELMLINKRTRKLTYLYLELSLSLFILK